jgi:predicted transcriptional regulator of viral defense system
MTQEHSPKKDLESIAVAAEKVLEYNAGMARTRDFEKAGIGRWRLPDLISTGLVEKVGHGLYRSRAVPYSTNMELAQACVAVPKGVIFLASALAYYQLTTFNPPKICVAVEHKSKVVLPEAPPIQLHYLSKRYHQMGVNVVSVQNAEIRIYNREKTLCDCLRFRNTIGIDVCLEALKSYIDSPEASIDKLLRHADQCRVGDLMRRYLEAMI